MRRREVILGLGGAFALAPPARAAGRRMPLVGMLASVGMLGSDFQRGLREAGFVEGRNVAIDRRFLGGQYDLLRVTVADFVRRKVDVLVTVGPAAALAAKDATTAIPIVFQSWDPVLEGLVESLARPGGNLTGVSMLDSELTPKRLELLSEVVPRARVFALLVNPKRATTAAVIRNARSAAQAKRLELQVLKASSDPEIYAAFAAIHTLRADGLVVDLDSFFGRTGGTLAALAAINGIPAIYGWRGITQVGGLMSYGPSYASAHRLMGIYTGKILRGADPADLPVVQPDKFELVVNLKAARDLGLKVPPTLLALADKVIQ
jgi:ABC-type uncharacterized transport system substrate-binding protein